MTAYSRRLLNKGDRETRFDCNHIGELLCAFIVQNMSWSAYALEKRCWWDIVFLYRWIYFCIFYTWLPWSSGISPACHKEDQGSSCVMARPGMEPDSFLLGLCFFLSGFCIFFAFTLSGTYIFICICAIPQRHKGEASPTSCLSHVDKVSCPRTPTQTRLEPLVLRS